MISYKRRGSPELSFSSVDSGLYTYINNSWKVSFLTSVTKNHQFGALSKPIISQNQKVGQASFIFNRQWERYLNSELFQEIM